MSEEIYAIGAVISIVATLLKLWSNWRRRQIERRLIRSLTPEQRRVIGLDAPSDVMPRREDAG